MSRRAQIFLLRCLIAALAPGEWLFWSSAAWRSRLRTRLENLQAGDDEN